MIIRYNIVREYISAVENAEGSSVDSTWIGWANRKADWYDPIVDFEDPVLGKRKRDISRNQDDLSEYTKEKPYVLENEEAYIPDVDW